MDNLPNELLHLIVSFNDNTIKYLSYRSCKLLNSFKTLSIIQVCNYIGYDGRKTKFWINKALITITIIIPNSIKQIIFGINVNEQLLEILPSMLTHINFGYHFNQSVDNLPGSLKKITFGWEFNQKVDNLPYGITHLVFGGEFSQNVDKLPLSLISLFLGYSHSFDEPIDNLPRSVRKLLLPQFYELPINNLPQLTYVSINKFNHHIPSLTQLHNLKYECVTYPPILHSISFDWRFNKEVTLPNGIKRVKFRRSFNQLIDNFPDSITHLNISGGDFNQIITKYPLNLTYISFGNKFNHAIDNLPNSVTHVKCGNEFNQTIGNLINITHLKFSGMYLKDISHLINLTYLGISKNDEMPHNFEKLFCLIAPYLAVDFNKVFLPSLKKLKCNSVKNLLNITHLNVNRFDKISSSVIYLKTLKEYEDRIPSSVKYVTLR